jgi:hypothetical protein
MRRLWPRIKPGRRANVKNVVREQYQELIQAQAEYERQQESARSPFAEHWKPEPRAVELALTVEDYVWLRAVRVRV